MNPYIEIKFAASSSVYPDSATRGVHGSGRADSGWAKTSKIHKNIWPEPGLTRLYFLEPDPARLANFRARAQPAQK